MSTLAHALQAAAPALDGAPALHRRLLLPPLLLAGAIAAWAAAAPLAGAVVASGQVQAEYGRKTVQHQEGGIVQRLLVRPGQAVRRGELLMVVADARNDAGLALLTRQRDAERLRVARSLSELGGSATVDWPASSGDDAEGAAAREREQQLFDARRRLLAEQVDALQRQQAQAREREQALQAQLAAAARAATLGREELQLNESLVAAGFIQRTRVMALERGVADLDARHAGIRSQIAEARSQAAALGAEIASARGAWRQRAADEHKEAAARLRELEDRLGPTRDLAERQQVRAPVDGTVMALRVGAEGTAVGPREPLLEIAPSGEALVIEAPVDPHDIDHLRAGGAAEVRLAAFDARRTPLLAARVASVTPDAVTDGGSRRSAYLVRVAVAADELARHPELHLQAGMPAEVFITTPSRSLLDYLLEPVGLFARRALREP